jgi:hypothetical protein
MTPSNFIGENFDPSDRLAVVLLNKRTQEVVQRLASAESIAAPDFQAWLRHKNAQRCEIYLSMNALHASASGRTKADVETIRHLFLDFDDSGTAAVETLLKREDMPKPNYLTKTSPDKWHVIWRVEGFTVDQAEQLQRELTRQTGSDIAATDCARVLRLPGFYNYKYIQRHLVEVEKLSGEVYGRERFPEIDEDKRGQSRAPGEAGTASKSEKSPQKLSQSEKDWAYAKRALARGESERDVIAEIARFRPEKHDPQYYAEITVRKAAEALNSENLRFQAGTAAPDR